MFSVLRACKGRCIHLPQQKGLMVLNILRFLQHDHNDGNLPSMSWFAASKTEPNTVYTGARVRASVTGQPLPLSAIPLSAESF